MWDVFLHAAYVIRNLYQFIYADINLSTPAHGIVVFNDSMNRIWKS